MRLIETAVASTAEDKTDNSTNVNNATMLLQDNEVSALAGYFIFENIRFTSKPGYSYSKCSIRYGF